MTSPAASDLQYWVAFSRIPRIGSARSALLEGHFGSLAAAWQANATELAAAGLDRSSVASVIAARSEISPDAEIERLARAGVKAYIQRDAAYPARLKEVDDRPAILYVRGELRPADEWAVAIVGTRRATPYGRQAAEHFATDLARQGITIVSGLARGIDAIAHRAALTAGGRTIAVLGSGVDIAYPPEHAKLAQEICEHGALVSDYPLGTQPRAEFFPRRNRILSAISLGVLVVEGDLDSGALITARCAIEQNREVFAVPGSIYSPTYRGTNKLIRDSEAKLVCDTEDILEELNLTMATQQSELREVLPADETEATLLRVLSSQPIHIDEVQRVSGLPIATVTGALAMLELKGSVKQMGAMSFVRTREASLAYSTDR